VAQLSVRAAAIDYSRTGVAWQAGPGRIYDALAEDVVATPGVDWSGRTVLDVGAGTGAAGRAVARAGGRTVAVDAAPGMLAAAHPRPPSLVADARALAVGSRTMDGYVAAFCLNHLTEPAHALEEARRVVRPGDPIVVSAYAIDDDHPVKAAVEGAAAEVGWRPPAWVAAMRRDAIPILATPQGASAVGLQAGLREVRTARLEVPFPHLSPVELVEWRLGMAQMAPFVLGLAPDGRRALVRRSLERLGPAAAPLVRRIVVLWGRS
jgi:SAM-dependent methyltransferase